MNTATRADSIKDRLTNHWLTEVGCAVSPMPLKDWHIAVADLGAHARFGLGHPMPWDEPALIIPFCPELIDAVTADLSEEDLASYLGALEFLIDVEIELISDGVSREDAIIEAEHKLNALGPGDMVLISDTQLRALDRGVGC